MDNQNNTIMKKRTFVKSLGALVASFFLPFKELFGKEEGVKIWGSRTAVKDSALKVQEIDLSPWLNKKAMKIVNTHWSNTVLEYYLDTGRPIDVSKNPFMEYKGKKIKPGLEKNDYSRDRKASLCQFMGITIQHEGLILEDMVYPEFANLINKAVDRDLIGFGCLMKPAKMEIVGVDSVGTLIIFDKNKTKPVYYPVTPQQIKDKLKKTLRPPFYHRTMLLFYPFMSKSLVEGTHKFKLIRPEAKKILPKYAKFYDSTNMDIMNNYLGEDIFNEEGGLPGYTVFQVRSDTDFTKMDKFDRYIQINEGEGEWNIIS